MKKVFIIMMALVILAVPITSCGTNEPVKTKDGSTKVVEDYGIFNSEKKDPTVTYQISTVIIICSAIFIETIVIPIWLIGWHLYEPVDTIQ